MYYKDPVSLNEAFSRCQAVAIISFNLMTIVRMKKKPTANKSADEILFDFTGK